MHLPVRLDPGCTLTSGTFTLKLSLSLPLACLPDWKKEQWTGQMPGSPQEIQTKHTHAHARTHMQPLFGFISSPLFAVSWWECATIWMFPCTLCEHACLCAMGSEYWCRLYFWCYREEAFGWSRSGLHVYIWVCHLCLCCSWKTCWTSSVFKKRWGFISELLTVAMHVQQFYSKYLITILEIKRH